MATAAPEANAAPAAGGGKKKLILIIAIALVVVLVGAGAAVMLLKKKPPAEEGEDGEETSHVEAAAHKPGTPPVFLPIDPFTVNLSDRETDRYAQVQVTLEVVDQKTADTLEDLHAVDPLRHPHGAVAQDGRRDAQPRGQGAPAKGDPGRVPAAAGHPDGAGRAGRGRGSAEEEERRRRSPPATR
jgi:flagellar basal body-associated protein FliL